MKNWLLDFMFWAISTVVSFSDFFFPQKLIFVAFLFENATIVILSYGVESNGSRERRPLFSFALRPIIGLPYPSGDRGDVPSNGAVSTQQWCSESRLPLPGGGISASDKDLRRFMSLPVSCFLFPTSERLSPFRLKKNEANAAQISVLQAP